MNRAATSTPRLTAAEIAEARGACAHVLCSRADIRRFALLAERMHAENEAAAQLLAKRHPWLKDALFPDTPGSNEA
jgi:hypothetical protein